jgi:hypothetical protein
MERRAMRRSGSGCRIACLAGGVAAAVLFTACGGGNGSCGGGACGGNLVGTWTITNICSAPPSSSTGTCTTATDTSRLKETGTITFNADQTYSINVTIGGSVNETIPTSCLGITCAEESALLSQSTLYSSAVCTTVGDNCSCQLVYAGQTLAGTGTYVIQGTSVTITTTGSSSGSTDNYCVIGSTMTLSSMPMPGMTGGSSITLTRR